MSLVFSPGAEADLEEIGDYIAMDSPARALAFVHELREQCQVLTQLPLAFPARDELAPGVRMMPYRRYLIFYRPIGREIRIERILHSATGRRAAVRGLVTERFGASLTRFRRSPHTSCNLAS
jgi:toxin ParE1/3/4